MSRNNKVKTSKKIDNCHFCKNTEPYVRATSPIFSDNSVVTFVECGKCGARGPIVYVGEDKEVGSKLIEERAVKAIALWNIKRK